MQRPPLSIRSGKGLGDSLYLQSVARHLAGIGHEIEVCSNWPDVFRPLAGKVKVSPFRRDNVDRVAHYIKRKAIQGTDQFTDCCISAGLVPPVELRLDWQPVDAELVRRLKGSRRPVIVVQLPRLPMDRLDGYGLDLLPDGRVLQHIINRLKARGAFIVQIGKGEPLFRFDGIDLDLANKTSIAEMIDTVWAADGVLGYCSFIAPLAESLGKPSLLVWSRRGLKSRNPFIRAIVPGKILHRKSSRAVVDDCSGVEWTGSADALCHQAGGAGAV